MVVVISLLPGEPLWQWSCGDQFYFKDKVSPKNEKAILNFQKVNSLSTERDGKEAAYFFMKFSCFLDYYSIVFMLLLFDGLLLGNKNKLF